MEKIQLGNGTLFNGGATKVLKKLNKSVDAIVTDPPYNISRKNNFKTIGRRGIDFGTWDKEFDQLTWIEQAVKLVKKRGSVIIFNDWKNMGIIARKLKQEGCNIKDLIRWVKKNPMPRNINRRYVPDCEFAIWATKNGKWVFNKSDKDKYLRPEYRTAVVSGHEKTNHPTQKSLELIKKIVSVHTNKSNIVLDPFIGSGTLALACEQLDRRWVGIEKKQKYFKLAKKRISSYLKNHE